MSLLDDQKHIIERALRENLPDQAVKETLATLPRPRGRRVLVAFGKAAWQMAEAAYDAMPDGWTSGVVITKYGHAKGAIGAFQIFEAGHPVLDDNSVRATRAATRLVSDLSADDQVVVLISGGGSALFEDPSISLERLAGLNEQLLASGASITEINTIRKRFSNVKGGRFAALCAPAQVYSIILSDILGDPLDMIASGPTVPDRSTSAEALRIAEQYALSLSNVERARLGEETPKSLPNSHPTISGSVRLLAESARRACAELGYDAEILTTSLDGEAREAGRFMGAIARTLAESRNTLGATGGAHGAAGAGQEPIDSGQGASRAGRKRALLFGGETVVHLTGTGKGGRNQEIALAAAEPLAGLPNVMIFSFGSDGTDGPTDAAGGWVDGTSYEKLRVAGYSPADVLKDNNAYAALEAVDGLIVTGPTGTNVNDLSVVLIGE
ncbi:MAG: glycerate kinase [Peptoniphilaceae bacterium]|nr:glycerate kinase [Peptoniphilaceae bacterium]